LLHSQWNEFLGGWTPKAQFQDDWKLQNGGSGEITFKGKGYDLYITLNNQNNNSSHQYNIIINGWGNAKSRIGRGDGSEICHPNVNAVDLNIYNEYKVVIDAGTKTFSVHINGNLSFSCTDPGAWNAPNATHFGISRYHGATFHMCDVKASLPSQPPQPPTPATFNVGGELLNANTGKMISPLNGVIITITNNATKTPYNAVLKDNDAFYSASFQLENTLLLVVSQASLQLL